MTLRKNAELYRTQANITAEFLELIKKKRATGEQVELLDILVGERITPQLPVPALLLTLITLSLPTSFSMKWA